jgi:hypothetical protein
MSRSIVMMAALLIAGCASGGGGGAADEAADWVPGAYVLEGRVPQVASGRADYVEFTAELVIGPDGTLSLTSRDGLCQDPDPAQAVLDAQRRQQTFVCGDVRYELRPGANAPRGEITATVEDQEVVLQCLRYERRPDGTQVCVETRESIVIQRNLKRARLVVLQRPG